MRTPAPRSLKVEFVLSAPIDIEAVGLQKRRLQLFTYVTHMEKHNLRFLFTP